MGQACEFTSVSFAVNPVKTGVNVTLTVTLKDFSHARWSELTHTEMSVYTHKELSGDT